jgi:hypothetical protein
VRRITPGEEVIVSRCRKCGNEIKLAVDGLTRAQVEERIKLLDCQVGECPGGFHVELGGWRRLWDLDQAVAEHYATGNGALFNEPTREELTFDGEASYEEAQP